MPLTFPSHAAAVLPLKFARRRWFDGVALVIGSAAPDFPYSLSPYLNYNAHTWTGLVLFCGPVTVLLSLLTRAAAPAVVANLPDWRVLRPFALPDYAALAVRRHRLAVTALSAWLGALSHRLWDLVTHGANATRGTASLTFLDAEAFAGQPWWRVLHYGSSVLGGLAVLAAAIHIGRTPLASAGRRGCTAKARPAARVLERRRSRVAAGRGRPAVPGVVPRAAGGDRAPAGGGVPGTARRRGRRLPE
ncbi:DUF4184 family protein [Dactylosporangium sp. CA-139066]|uniref:DUF4184 family protein n=1 Tax=Dactylosporangium sp. CA-139066 TaxID=3239930 RepID=UPI003D8FCF70